MEARNRFKGLNLIDRVPGELWMEVHDILQEAVIKTIPKKKKCKKAKWLSGKALQIAEKRREAKGKGEKEKYTNLNGEFQRIARRGKKAFFSVIGWGIDLDYLNGLLWKRTEIILSFLRLHPSTAFQTRNAKKQNGCLGRPYK